MSRSIYYIQYANPAVYPPLEHGALVLSAAGFAVTFIGKEAQGESNRMTFDPRLSARQIRWRHQRPGMRQKLHYAAFCLHAFWRVRRDRPSWVYCSDHLSCIVAQLVKRFTSVPVVYHEHDAPVIDDVRSAFGRIALRARRWVGRRADMVVVPNEERLRDFVRVTGRSASSYCVYNVPRADEARSPRSSCAGGPLRLVYHGSINPERLPLAVLKAMSTHGAAFALTIVGYETAGSVGYVSALLREADRLGLSGNVQYRGTCSRAHTLEIASGQDVGLAFMPMQSDDLNMAHMAGASNKPFDYLACGLALLVSDLPEWRQMFVEPGYGLACDPRDAMSLAAALRQLQDDRVAVRAMGERGRQRIVSNWNYEAQFAPLLRKIIEKRAVVP